MQIPSDAARKSAAFLIVIDTEGDNVWGRPRQALTKNSAFLPRFQALCEGFGFRPSYLANFEMANCEVFREFARDILARDKGEIGMHMHPWDSPPLSPLGAEDWFEQPYPCEYPDELLHQKVEFMTKTLEDLFQRPMVSHRAGRFGFSEAYCRSLVRLGYKIDCSVTPHVNWRGQAGGASHPRRPDYRLFPDDPYYLDETDISRPGSSSLLEAPMTIVRGRRPWARELVRRALGRREPRYNWMRPDGNNLAELLDVVEQTRMSGRPYLQFTLHSSEFMPGGSPTFVTAADIERLYDHLQIVFAKIAENFVGRTLGEFAEAFAARKSN